MTRRLHLSALTWVPIFGVGALAQAERGNWPMAAGCATVTIVCWSLWRKP